MFVYIKHGDNQQFMVNSNCCVFRLLFYIRSKIGLPKTDTIDLCDETGTMKMLFLIKSPGDYAIKFLTPRNTYFVCRGTCNQIQLTISGQPKKGHCLCDNGLGTRLQNAYLAFVPVLKTPGPGLIEALRTQCTMLERSRLKMLKMQEAAQRVALAESSMKLSGKSGGRSTRGPYYKTRADFQRRKDKPKFNKK